MDSHRTGLRKYRVLELEQNGARPTKSPQTKTKGKRVVRGFSACDTKCRRSHSPSVHAAYNCEYNKWPGHFALHSLRWLFAGNRLTLAYPRRNYPQPLAVRHTWIGGWKKCTLYPQPSFFAYTAGGNEVEESNVNITDRSQNVPNITLARIRR